MKNFSSTIAFLFTLAMLLAMCETVRAQVTVSNDRLAAVMPWGEFDYPRNAEALIHEPNAMDDIQLAFLIAEHTGQGIEMPAFASDSLIAAFDSLSAAVVSARDLIESQREIIAEHEATIAEMDAAISGHESEIAAKDATIVSLQAMITQFEDQVEPMMARIEELEGQVNYALQRVRELLAQFLAS